ncbi:hypothetical protein DYZ95_01420 [Apilactobacillus timberlakei]|nr:hypothetical protein DYZ95_01420 [Apilactobacillus timberlakei]
MKLSSEKTAKTFCLTLLILFIVMSSKFNFILETLLFCLFFFSICIKRMYLDERNNKTLYLIFNVCILLIVLIFLIYIFVTK